MEHNFLVGAQRYKNDGAIGVQSTKLRNIPPNYFASRLTSKAVASKNQINSLSILYA